MVLTRLDVVWKDKTKYFFFENLTSFDLWPPKFDLQGQISFWQPGVSESLDHTDTF